MTQGKQAKLENIGSHWDQQKFYRKKLFSAFYISEAKRDDIFFMERGGWLN